MSLITFYIDEGGEFTPHNPLKQLPEPWILGGFSCKYGDSTKAKKACAETVNQIVTYLESQPWIKILRKKIQQNTPKGSYKGLRKGQLKWQDLHYTELVTGIASFLDNEETWSALTDFDLEFLASLNRIDCCSPFVCLHPGSNLKNGNINYAAQVIEFINIALSDLAHHERIANGSLSIQFVLAERNDPYQSGLISLKTTQFLEAIQIGVASQGSVALLNTTKPFVDIRDDELDEGVKLADVVCGIARRKLMGGARYAQVDIASHSDYIVRLPQVEMMGIRTFLSLLNIRLKRARTYELEGDIVRAIAVHVSLEDVDRDTVIRLLRTLLTQDRPQAIRYSLDQLIEEIDRWAQDEDKARVFDSVVLVKDAVKLVLEELYGIELSPDFKAISHRIGSYALVWANHLGREQAAKEWLEELKVLGEEVKLDPQSSEALSQTEIAQVEKCINDGRFREAYGFVLVHVRRIARILDLSLEDFMCGDKLDLSLHFVLRAFTAYCRAALLFYANEFSLGLESQMEQVRRIRHVLTGAYDRCSQSTTIGSQSYGANLTRLLQLLCFASEHELLLGPATGDDFAKLSFVARECIRICRTHADQFCAAVMFRSVATLSLLNHPHIFGEGEFESAVAIVVNVFKQARPLRHPEEIILRESLMVTRSFYGPDAHTSKFKAAVESRLREWLVALSQEANVFQHQRVLAENCLRYASGQTLDESLIADLKPRIEGISRKWPDLDPRRVALLAKRAATIY